MFWRVFVYGKVHFVSGKVGFVYGKLHLCTEKKKQNILQLFWQNIKNIKIYKLFIIFLSIYLVCLFIVTIFVTNICCVQIEAQTYIYIYISYVVWLIVGRLTAAEAGWQKQPFYCWWLTALSKSSKLRPSAKWDSWTPPMLTWLSRLLVPHLPESNPATSHRFKRSLHSWGVRPPQDMAFLHCSVGLAGSWCMPQIAPNPVGSALPAASMGAIWNAGLEPQTCPRLTVAACGATDARGGQEGGGSSNKSTSASSTSATESLSDCEEPPSSSASSRSPCMSGLFALSISPLAALPLPRPLLGPCRSPPALWLLDWLATIFSS